MKPRDLFFLCLVVAPFEFAFSQSKPVTFASLLHEMVNYESVARWPQPAYRCLQASSYDRASVSPADPVHWFANLDFSNFIRTETRQGRKEWVMMDAEGPGCITRFWHGGPEAKGIIRIYLDGSETPVIEGKDVEILGGKGLFKPPFSACILPAVPNAGKNLFLPVPYSKKCLITYDGPNYHETKDGLDAFYYNINYRSYEAGTRVETFSMAGYNESKKIVEETGKILMNPLVYPNGQKEMINQELEPEARASMHLADGPAAVRRIEINLTAEDLAQALRSTVLQISFDGEQTVWCPVGDFSGSGVGLNPFHDRYRTATSDSMMICRWVMPFKNFANITLINFGKQKVHVTLKTVVDKWSWDDRSMYFHTTWHYEQWPYISDMPRDWNFINARGKGVMVGDVLALMSPRTLWWGEGDEKIYIDDESFPSHFGTGSEDYYGYAYGVPRYFSEPFHAQPRVDLYAHMGHRTNTRSRSLDAVPFTTALRFDMEAIGGVPNAKMAYAGTTYWYAVPGAQCQYESSPDLARQPLPTPYPGVFEALEGERMILLQNASGKSGVLQADNLGFSGNSIWWTEGKPGDSVKFLFEITKSGKYKLKVALAKSPDYGILQFYLDGKKVGGPLDLYSPAMIPSGEITLAKDMSGGHPEGGHYLKIQILGANDKAEKKYKFGLDYIRAEKQKADPVEFDNGQVKARFTPLPDGIKQEYFARRDQDWVLVAESVRPPKPMPEEANMLYDSSRDLVHRLIVPEILSTIGEPRREYDKVTVELSGWSHNRSVRQRVTLCDGLDYAHIEVDADLKDSQPVLEYLLSPFLFAPAEKPEFIHAPKLKFAKDDIFGDRTFYSPAVILQEKGLFCALVPDLDLINECMVLSPDARYSSTRIPGRPLDLPRDTAVWSMPTGLDLNMVSGLADRPLFSFGIEDAIATHHMHWLHPNDGSMVRHLESNRIKYGFDLFVRADAPRFAGFQEVSRFIWEQYGSPCLQLPRPQVMPFEEYARACFPASASYKGWCVRQPGWIIENSAPKGYPDLDEWQQWKLDGWPVGGYKNNAPDWYDMIEFTTWWNNMRDAPGIYWWGKRTADSSLVDKARRIVNLILLSPQNQGPFPVIYKVLSKRWQGNHWDPPETMDSSRVERYFSNESRSYQTTAMSKTCAHLLRYYRLCEPNERILPFVKKYGDFVASHIDPNGCLPSWFSAGLVPNPYLRFNGEQGVHIWFLSELYLDTKDQKYLDAAERMAVFMQREILPKQRWLDFEVYFSCGVKPMNFKDPYTGQDPRGNVSMSWAAEGFAALYRAGGNKVWLDAGEKVIDYLSLYQTAWAPHFIYTAYPFGGTDTDNGDAAWLNGHQAMLPGIFAWYGKELGRQDLIERGVALARASLVLTNLPENVANKVYNFPNYPTGLGPENIDHEGIPQTPLRTGASWCELGGLTGVADIMRELGGLYVNFSKNIAVGVNGVNVKSWGLDGNKIFIRTENAFRDLQMPWNKPFAIDLKVDGLKDNVSYQLSFNDIIINNLNTGQLKSYRLEVRK